MLIFFLEFFFESMLIIILVVDSEIIKLQSFLLSSFAFF